MQSTSKTNNFKKPTTQPKNRGIRSATNAGQNVVFEKLVKMNRKSMYSEMLSNIPKIDNFIKNWKMQQQLNVFRDPAKLPRIQWFEKPAKYIENNRY